jgi:hypothetical protein
VPAQHSFEFAIIRIVPRVEREEFINAGVIAFCLARRWLCARVHLDENRVRMLWPEVDMDLVRSHLEAIPKICAGDADAGPIAHLSSRERFHWLTAPRSTIIQVSPVHSGLCSDPEPTLRELFQQFVVTP